MRVTRTKQYMEERARQTLCQVCGYDNNPNALHFYVLFSTFGFGMSAVLSILNYREGAHNRVFFHFFLLTIQSF